MLAKVGGSLVKRGAGHLSCRSVTSGKINVDLVRSDRSADIGSVSGNVLIGFRVAGSGLARLSASLVFAADQQGGNRVLEDELFLCFGFQHDGILIKRAHISGDLRAVQQLNSDVLPACKSDVEKRFLNVNC